MIQCHHDKFNKSLVAGSAVSILATLVGGGLMIGGLSATFMVLYSLGLAIAGAGVGAVGVMTTAGAKGFDQWQSFKSIKLLVNDV